MTGGRLEHRPRVARDSWSGDVRIPLYDFEVLTHSPEKQAGQPKMDMKASTQASRVYGEYYTVAASTVATACLTAQRRASTRWQLGLPLDPIYRTLQCGSECLSLFLLTPPRGPAAEQPQANQGPSMYVKSRLKQHLMRWRSEILRPNQRGSW